MVITGTKRLLRKALNAISNNSLENLCHVSVMGVAIDVILKLVTVRYVDLLTIQIQLVTLIVCVFQIDVRQQQRW